MRSERTRGTVFAHFDLRDGQSGALSRMLRLGEAITGNPPPIPGRKTYEKQR
jgi:hypothetical protein